MKIPKSLLLLAALSIGACQANGTKEEAPEEEPATPPPTVQEFVRQVYIHGVPYDEAASYGSKAVPVLLDMLKDPKEEAAWANVAVTLCIIGDESAVDPLLDFITSGEEGTLSPRVYAAKSGAVMGLGYLVNKTKNKKALDFLVDSAAPQAWTERNVKWSSPNAASRTQRDTQLSTMAILGLALAGTPEAGAALRSLKEPGPTAEAMAFRTEVSGAVDQAIAEHTAISKEGLSAYYKKRER